MILHRTMKKERRRQSSCVKRRKAFRMEKDMMKMAMETRNILQNHYERSRRQTSVCKRYLSMWNCKTGTSAMPRPEGFEFREGDYFGISDAYMADDVWNDTLMIMGVKGMKEAKNYRPDGSVETRPIHKYDIYVFDGQEWVLV